MIDYLKPEYLCICVFLYSFISLPLPRLAQLTVEGCKATRWSDRTDHNGHDYQFALPLGCGLFVDPAQEEVLWGVEGDANVDAECTVCVCMV